MVLRAGTSSMSPACVASGLLLENRTAEACNCRFRDECLNIEL